MKIFILSGLIFAIYASKSGAQTIKSDTLPHGLWKVERVSIEKNTESYLQASTDDSAPIVTTNATTKVTTNAEYKSVAEVKSHISCPQELIISEKNIVLRYPNGVEATIEHSLEDQRLTILTYDGTMQAYQYRITDGNLIFTVTHHYNNMLPVRQGSSITEQQVERVTENWAITLKKSDTNESDNETK